MADVNITIGATLDALVNGVNSAKSSLETLQTGVRALVAAFGIREISEFVGHMTELGEQAERTAATLGISTVAAQELRVMSQLSGLGADSLTTSLTRLQVGLERGQLATSQSARALSAMGISARELLAVPVDKQMNVIADAVHKLHEEGINAAPALAMISRGLAGMTPILEQGGAAIDDWKNRMIAAGAIVSDDVAKNLAYAHRELTLLGAAFQGLGEVIVSAFTPSIVSMVGELTKALGALNALVATGNFLNYTFGYMARLMTLLSSYFLMDAEAIKEAQKALSDYNHTFDDLIKNYQTMVAATGGGTKPLHIDVGPNRDAIKQADDAFKQSETIIKNLRDLYVISELQKTQLLILEIKKRTAAEIAAGEDAKTAMAKQNLDIEKAQADLTKKLMQDWMQVADSIAGSINSQWRGILAGTTSFSQAMKNIFADMVVNLLSAITKLAVQWALQQVFMQTVGKGMVAASAASFVSRLTADAALVFGGVFANLAPVMGPAAAGPAATSQAAVLAELANIPKYAVGIDYVPQDQFAYLHAGERVVPAEQNTQSGFGGTMALNISAVDANSFAAMLRRNPAVFDSLLNKAMQRGSLNTLLR